MFSLHSDLDKEEQAPEFDARTEDILACKLKCTGVARTTPEVENKAIRPYLVQT